MSAAQRVALGVHAPQTPAPMHTVGHAAPWFTKAPALLHIWGCLPLHVLAGGLQMPVQFPAEQPKLHATSTQCPFASQVCGCAALHCFALGVQSPHRPAPKQTPPQTVSLAQLPVGLHVWGVFALRHFRSPGLHTPQTPVLHTNWHAAPLVH